MFVMHHVDGPRSAVETYERWQESSPWRQEEGVRPAQEIWPQVAPLRTGCSAFEYNWMWRTPIIDLLVQHARRYVHGDFVCVALSSWCLVRNWNAYVMHATRC
jgi:hypothetical protein